MERSESPSHEQRAGWLGRSVRNFSALSAAEAVKVGLNTVATVYLARVLRAEAFGIFGFALAALACLTAVVDGGFTVLGTRDVARDRSAVRALVSAIVSIRLVLAAAAFVLLLGFIAGTDLQPVVRRALLWSSLSVISTAFLLDWVFYGLGEVRAISAAAVMKAAVFLGIVLLAVHEPSDVWAAVVAQVIGELVAAGWLWAVYVRRFGSVARSVDWGAWFHRWRQALPISVGQILRAVNYWFGIIVIGLWLDPAAVGQYTSAQKLMLFLLGFASLYFLTYLPLIAGALQRDPGEVGQIISKSFSLTVSLTLPIAFGGTVLADEIVRFIYGPDYAASTLPFRILIWVLPLVIASAHFRNTVLAANLQRVDLGCVILSAVANVVANLALVPTFGAVGAAIAMTISEATLLVAEYVVVRRRIARPSIAARLPGPLAAATLMALAVWWARPMGLPAALGIGILLYFSLMCLFGALRPADVIKLFRA
ncbi:MAG: flippase [Gemmatimonadaceae bacterium]